MPLWPWTNVSPSPGQPTSVRKTLRPGPTGAAPSTETELGAAGFAAQVELVEPVGSEAYANLRHGGQALVVRLPPRELPLPGEALPLRIDPRRLHFFDAGSGIAMRP